MTLAEELAALLAHDRAGTPVPPMEAVAADTDVGALRICRLLGGHWPEGRIVAGRTLGRCALCGLGLCTDGN